MSHQLRVMCPDRSSGDGRQHRYAYTSSAISWSINPKHMETPLGSVEKPQICVGLVGTHATCV